MSFIFFRFGHDHFRFFDIEIDFISTKPISKILMIIINLFGNMIDEFVKYNRFASHPKWRPLFYSMIEIIK